MPVTDRKTLAGMLRQPSGAYVRKAWLIGALLSTALMLFLFAYADVYYPNNDDVFIMRAFMGYQPGGPAAFVAYMYPLISWPMHELSVLVPGIPWFSVLQIVFLWLANMVIVKSVWQCFCRANRPVWAGTLTAVCFLMLFSVHVGARVTYTATSAMLVAAAVAQLLSVDMASADKRKSALGVAGSVILYLLAVSLRRENVLAALPVLGIGLCYHALSLWDGQGLRLRDHKPVRPAVVALIAYLAATALLMGWSALDTRLQGEEADVRWQHARIAVMDYLNMDKLPTELTTSVGWSEAQTKQLQSWNTMDAVFTAQAFDQVAAHAPSAAKPTLHEMLAILYKRSQWALLAIFAVAALGFFCVGGVMASGRGKRYRLLLPLLLAGALCASMIAYLAVKGRMPERALLAAVLPVAAMLVCLLAQCVPRPLKPQGERKTRAARLLMCALVCLPLMASVGLTFMQVRRVPEKWEYNTFADLDKQALDHPSLLLIYGRNLSGDTRMFPDVSEGMTQNLTFWGGWGRGSKEYRAKLAAFGLDAEHFTAKDWLNPAVRLVILRDKTNDALLAYLREQLGPKVTYRIDTISAGLSFEQFYLPQEDAAATGQENGDPGKP